MERFAEKIRQFQASQAPLDYTMHNFRERMTLHQCICLLLSLDPLTTDYNCDKPMYSELMVCATNFIDSGVLPCETEDMFWPINRTPMLASQFVAWAKAHGFPVPAEWRPESGKPQSGERKSLDEYQCVKRYDEMLLAQFKLLGERNPAKNNTDVFLKMKTSSMNNARNAYSASSHYLANDDYVGLMNSVRRGAKRRDLPPNPLKNEKYLAVLDKQRD